MTTQTCPDCKGVMPRLPATCRTCGNKGYVEVPRGEQARG